MPHKDYNDKSGLAYYWLEVNMGRVLLVVLFAGIGLWGLLLEGRTDLSLAQKLTRGMGPELAGIVIAAVTIEVLAEKRQEAERKKILISQMGSKYRDVTEIAIIELRNREWLYDGSLSKVYLGNANLSGARLQGVDLKGADLWKADLSGGHLREATLSKARLQGANLGEARLQGADPSGAYLKEVSLSGARLDNANLSGAWDWTIEQLEQAESLVGAIMPDKMQLGQEETKYRVRIEGPTFEEWKAQYLARQEVERAESEANGKPDDVADGRAESGSRT